MNGARLMSDTIKFIACTFSAGMLPSEYSVTIHPEGKELSLFAPKSFVRESVGKEGKGFLEVQIIDPKHNVIALPSEVMETGRRFIEYPLNRLVSA